MIFVQKLNVRSIVTDLRASKEFLQELLNRFPNLANDVLKDAIAKLKGLRPKVPFAIEMALDKGVNPNVAVGEIIKLPDDLATLVMRLFYRKGKRLKKANTEEIIENAIENKKMKLLHYLVKGKRFKTKHDSYVNFLLRDYKEPIQARPLVKTAPERKVKRAEKEKNQIESFLDVWFAGKEKGIGNKIKKFLIENYRRTIGEKNLRLYEKMIRRMMDEEKKHGDCYAFYNAYEGQVRLIWDLMTAIHDWFEIVKREDRPVLRFLTQVEQYNMKDFIDSWNQKQGEKQKNDRSWFKKDVWIGPEEKNLLDDGILNQFEDDFEKKFKPVWNDRPFPLPAELLSVNFSPFGGTGFPTEATFKWFVEPSLILKGMPFLNKTFDDYGFDKKYIQELIKVYHTRMTPKVGGNIMQILIPKDIVYMYIYLAMPFGTPYRNRVQKFESDSVNSDIKTSEFIERYIHNPFSLVDLKEPAKKRLMSIMQGRIVFFPEFFEKNSGIKIITHQLLGRKAYEKKEKLYKQEVANIVAKMFREWFAKKGYTKVYAKRLYLMTKKHKGMISKSEERELKFLDDFVKKLAKAGRIITSHMGPKVYRDFNFIRASYEIRAAKEKKEKKATMEREEKN